MKRREFIMLFGGAAASDCSERGEPAAMAVIGFLYQVSAKLRKGS